MAHSKLRDLAFETVVGVRAWFAAGSLRDMAKGAGKIAGGLILYLLVLLGAFMVSGAVGIIAGTYMRFAYDGSRLYFNVGKDWAENVGRASGPAPEIPLRPFEAKTICNGTPFIPISEVAMFWLGDATTKRVLEKEMITRTYFDAVPLESGTRYVPKLLHAKDARSPVTFAKGRVKRIVVELITPEGSRPRHGLIPLNEYEEYLRSIGR